MAVPDCPALHSSLDEDALIKRYFDNGYTYKDIRAFLEAKHGIVLSEDQLRGRLKRLGLKPVMYLVPPAKYSFSYTIILLGSFIINFLFYVSIQNSTRTPY